MVVSIKLHQVYKEFLNDRFVPEDGVLKLELPQDARPRDVIRLLGIPERDVRILMVNSKPSALEAPLKDKDHIFIFPPIAGG